MPAIQPHNINLKYRIIMSNIALTIEAINKLQPLEIATSDVVRERFIQIHDTLWGAGTGEPAYERESHHFNNKLRDDADLAAKSTRFSIFSAFIDLAILGLSCEPGTRALCYLQGRNYKIGKNPQGKDIYEGRLVVTVSGYGELVMRARAGQIRHADNPVLVYQEDTFSFGEQNGQKVINYMCNLPHTTGHIIAAYLKITRADGSIDYSVMLEQDWLRLAGYSAKNNRRWDNDARAYVGKANELYTANNGTIDTGFLCAKLIKHAFRTYPKVRIGKATLLESQQDDQIQQEIDDFYGLTSGAEAPVSADPASFVPSPSPEAGVRIDPSAGAPAPSAATVPGASTPAPSPAAPSRVAPAPAPQPDTDDAF